MMLFLFLYTISAMSTVDCRKTYDIESESMKLYGESLNSVLLRFRKSPEYLSILNDRADATKEQLLQITAFVQDHTLLEMTKAVYIELSNSTENSSALRSRLANKAYFRSFIRRQFVNTSTMPPKERLDTYKYLHKGMPAADVNYFKDIGFEYAGQTIHKIIHNMDPALSTVISTKQFNDESDDTTTKGHDKKHVVTSQPTIATTESMKSKHRFRVRHKVKKQDVPMSNKTIT